MYAAINGENIDAVMDREDISPKPNALDSLDVDSAIKIFSMLFNPKKLVIDNTNPSKPKVQLNANAKNITERISRSNPIIYAFFLPKISEIKPKLEDINEDKRLAILLNNPI